MGRLKEDALACANRYTTALTLGDLMNQGLDVFCWCNRCGHNAVLEARLLAGQMGAAQAVPEVGARMRCSAAAPRTSQPGPTGRWRISFRALPAPRRIARRSLPTRRRSGPAWRSARQPGSGAPLRA